LVHISQLGSGRVARTEDVVKVGDEVVVKVISVDDDGKVRLTCRVTGDEGGEEGAPPAGFGEGRPPRRDRDDRGGDRGGRGGGGGGRRPERRPERQPERQPSNGEKDEFGPVPQARFRPKR
jgi:polyribonucleotide nucleotidyltransferase